MEEPSTFDALVLELSADERMILLERLKRASTVSSEPLYARPPVTDKVDYQAAYKAMGLLTRIVVFLTSLFTGVPKEEVVKDRLLAAIGHAVEMESPGLVDLRRKMVLGSLRDELLQLRAAARYFYDLLDRTLDKKRGPFYAFLASLEFEPIHVELTNEADPFTFAGRNALATDCDVRVGVLAAMESAMSHISDEQRRAMYHDVRSLHVLKKLSGFLFDRLIGSFQADASGRQQLAFHMVADHLRDLGTILASLDQPPSLRLMEALLAFVFNDDLGKEDFDLDAAVQSELVKADKALAAIRAFNARVPIESLYRLTSGDPNAQCERVSGGEDWFASYKAYWRERIDRRCQRFSAERRIKRLEGDITALVGEAPQTLFEQLSETGSESVPPVRFARALMFLESFYRKVFLGDINRPLKIILLEGEFYKRDNRLEFTDAYNAILQTSDALKSLDRRLGPEGELGSAYFHAKNEVIPVQIKRRKVESCIQAADTEAETVLRRASDAMAKMQLILKGILSGEARGRYDSLSNLSRMEGRANREFLKAVEMAKDRFELAVNLLGELSRLALSSQEPS